MTLRFIIPFIAIFIGFGLISPSLHASGEGHTIYLPLLQTQALPNDPYTLVYRAQPNSNSFSDIFLSGLNGDTYQIRRVGTEEIVPLFSPDGSLLSYETRGDVQEQSLMVLNWATGHTRTYTLGRGVDIDSHRWSPNSQSFAYSNIDGTTVIAFETGTTSTIERDSFRIEWLPTSEQLVYGAQGGLYRVDADGSHKRALLVTSETGATHVIGVLPDSRVLITFKQDAEDDPELYLIDPYTLHLDQITNDPLSIPIRPSLSPRGTYIGYIVAQQPDPTPVPGAWLRVIDNTGNLIADIHNTDNQCNEEGDYCDISIAGWMPDERMLFYNLYINEPGTTDGYWNLYRVNTDGDTRSYLVASHAYGGYVSSDGRYLAYVVKGEEENDFDTLIILDLVTNETKVLARHSRIEMIHWRPIVDTP